MFILRPGGSNHMFCQGDPIAFINIWLVGKYYIGSKTYDHRPYEENIMKGVKPEDNNPCITKRSGHKGDGTLMMQAPTSSSSDATGEPMLCIRRFLSASADGR